MDYVPTNRERSREAERTRMPKHGKNTGTLYANAIRKRLRNKQALKERNARKEEYVQDR